ncbi:hypothetical protein AWENTII_011639 [Aspergillus wentii]|nr:hypothetical protein MW887_006098 [Aspergillus wentii]
MPKRKIGDVDGSDNKYRPLSLQAVRLKSRYEQGAVALSRALKTARGFERQKLGRREKTAKKENETATLERLAGEINALKTLDLNVTAQKYLFKQLIKTKRIAESPHFIEFKDAQSFPTDGPRDTAEANVTARLFKSNPVQKVVPGIMDDVKKMLKVDEKPAVKKNKTEENEGSSRAKSKEPETKADKRTKSDRKTESAASNDEPEGDIEMDDAESLDLAQFDSRLASGSDDDDDDEDEDENESNRRTLLKNDHNSDISISRSPTPEEEDEDEDENDNISISGSESESPPSKKAKSNKKLSAADPVTSTTFLPSLSMGGYFSGSESEAEDIDSNEPPRRKNRMGQQARRALWEKKFGSGANHVKNQAAKDKRNRDSGWDTRRGATGGGDRRRGGGGFGGRDAGGRQGGGSGMPRRKPEEDNKPLHPSWEAAKKAKEAKATAAFAGKKVTFD